MAQMKVVLILVLVLAYLQRKILEKYLLDMC